MHDKIRAICRNDPADGTLTPPVFVPCRLLSKDCGAVAAHISDFRSLRRLVMSNDPRVRRLDAAVSEVLMRPIGPTTEDATPGAVEAIEELRWLSARGSTSEHGLDDIGNALLDFYCEALHDEGTV